MPMTGNMFVCSYSLNTWVFKDYSDLKLPFICVLVNIKLFGSIVIRYSFCLHLKYIQYVFKSNQDLRYLHIFSRLNNFLAKHTHNNKVCKLMVIHRHQYSGSERLLLKQHAAATDVGHFHNRWKLIILIVCQHHPHHPLFQPHSSSYANKPNLRPKEVGCRFVG